MGEKSVFRAMRDREMLSWLFGFVRRRLVFLGAAFVLMTLTAALEIAVPYIAAQAVDRHISLLWAKSPEGGFVELSSPELVRQYARPDAPAERYFAVNPSDPEASEIARKHSRLFEQAEGGEFISGGNLLSLKDGDIKTLRAGDVRGLLRLAILMGVCVAGIFVMSSLSNYLLKVSGERIIHDIRSGTFSRVMLLPQKFFDLNSTGVIATRVTNDLNSISDMYSSVLVQTVKDLFVFAGVAVVMFRLDYHLALMMVAIVAAAAVVAHLFRARLRFSHRKIRRSIARLNSFVQESIRGIRIIKDYGREDANLHRFEKTNKGNFLANMEQLWVYVVFRPFMEYAAIAAVGVIIWHGGVGVIDGRFTAGTLIAFLYYARMMFRPVLEVSEKYNILQSAIAATENLYDINTVEPERAGDLKPPAVKGGEIEFHNVWFSYGGGKWALKDVSFKVPAGKWAAIVGLTGSGKSTIFNLIFRLYEPQRGKITFDGEDIADIDLKWLRNRIAPVFQERREYEKKDGSSLRFLSSGQEQVRNIEEVLSKDPSVVIMDEATSNMDAKTEVETVADVRENARRRGFTLITIAHRLSSVREADSIIVVNKGVIAESGTHSELDGARGVYHSLRRFARGA
ncbi:MAG: ABC transporter ATP-binding protein [Thermodesulfobacteriota bacterium]